MNVFRPADAGETAAAYVSALKAKCPTCIVCSRQNLPQLPGDGKQALKGGYVVSDSKKIDLVIIASGSEVGLALDTKTALEAEGIGVRVVSMPCMEIFEKQSKSYRDSVIPPKCDKRLAMEAGIAMPWYKYVGLNGDVLSIDTFGESGKAEMLFDKYGFTVENAVAKAKAILK